MLSKNNKQLITRMNAKQKQRFGLRKLSIGVASVLLGTTFLLGATAQADTVNYAGSGTEHETASVNNNTTNKLDNQSNQLTLSPVEEANQRSNSNDQLSENEIANNKSVSEQDTKIKNNNYALNNLAINSNETQLNEAATDNKSDINNLDFTGAISGFKKTTQGKSGINFNAGDTADLTYTIRSAGDTSKLVNYYWPVKSHYLAMIPAGFKLNSWSSNFDKDDYQITALGKVGPDGEYVYLIALDKTPYYGIPVSFTAHMQATTDLATYGGHDYHGIDIPGLLMAVNDNNIFDSSHAITLGNQTYHVTNCSPFLYGNGGQEIKYTMVPGTTQLSENNYKIEKITSTKDDATGTGNAGYEEIVSTVHLNGSVHEGDYIDFHLGISYTDNATGKAAYKLYDSNLSSNFKLNNIGTVYNMGTFYRLVFSSAVESLNNPTFELNLRWGSQNNQASLNNNDNVYLYQETNDPSKDPTKFIYTPTNDVTINGQSSASGLQVNGMYIYTTKPISTGNKQIGSASIPSVNRTWNQQGDVAVNTIWSNTQTVILSPAKTGNEFDIKTTITKDPSNLVTFTFTSADDMKKAIQSDVATLDTQKLANEINGANGMYTDLITTKGKQPKVNVVVTMSTTKDPNDPNKETAIWHVKLANADSANTAKINLIGAVATVTATANNFTMPSGINSYDQDIAASKKIHTNTYDGAVTSNEQLLKVLQNLPIALTQVVSYKDGKPNEASGVFGGPWHGSIAYNGDSKVDGGGSATDLVTASIDIRTLDSTNLTPQNLTYQGSTGTVIKFAGLQNVYNALSGYHFIKVVSVKNGTETELPNVDPTELDSISFGTASKNNPTQFIIYVQKDQQKVNATLNFVDDNTNAQDLSSYNTSDSGIDGAPIIFNDVSQSIKTLIGKHYELTKVTETNGDNIINGMNPQSINWMTLFGKYGTSGVTFTIHFDHDTKNVNDSKNVKETVHFVFDDGSKADDDRVQNVTFKRSGAQDLVTNKTTWNAWTPGYSQTISTIVSPTIKGYTPDSQEISAVTVTPTSNDLVKTVTYRANDQQATITYLDDTTGKTLFTDQANGKYGETIVFKTSPTTQITAYEQQHYVVAGNSYTGQPTYQADDKYNNFVVHLKHQTEPAKETKTITETIHYVHTDGSKIHDDHVSNVVFHLTGTKDLVTNQTTWNAWTPGNSQTIITIVSPTIKGYTPDLQEIVAVTVTPTSNDLVKTVTYRANDQQATITYLDDTTGKTLFTDQANGKYGEIIVFKTSPTTQITAYEQQHYVVEGNSYTGQPTYQADNKQNNFVVHLKHQTEPTKESKTITETVHYVYTNGTKAANDYQARIKFERAGTKDLVTNQTIWDNWTPNNSQFAGVNSPLITGYTANQLEIAPVIVNAESNNLNITVTYNANAIPTIPVINSHPEVPSSKRNNTNKQIPNRNVNVQRDQHLLSDKTVDNSSSFKQKIDNHQQLPQTGNDDTNINALAGLSLASLASLLGFAEYDKKRKADK